MEDHQHDNGGYGPPDRGDKKYRVTVISPKNKTQMVAAGDAYLADLAEIVRSRDLNRFRAFLHTGKLALPDDMLNDPFKLLTMLHQLTLSFPELAELHQDSQQWLDDYTVLGRKGLNEAAKVSAEQKREEFEASQPPAGEGRSKAPRRTIVLRNVNQSQRPENN